MQESSEGSLTMTHLGWVDRLPCCAGTVIRFTEECIMAYPGGTLTHPNINYDCLSWFLTALLGHKFCIEAYNSDFINGVICGTF